MVDPPNNLTFQWGDHFISFSTSKIYFSSNLINIRRSMQKHDAKDCGYTIAPSKLNRLWSNFRFLERNKQLYCGQLAIERWQKSLLEELQNGMMVSEWSNKLLIACCTCSPVWKRTTSWHRYNTVFQDIVGRWKSNSKDHSRYTYGLC